MELGRIVNGISTLQKAPGRPALMGQIHHLRIRVLRLLTWPTMAVTGIAGTAGVVNGATNTADVRKHTAVLTRVVLKQIRMRAVRHRG
jgi:hypothetical protein